jgi:hypothetical protein
MRKMSIHLGRTITKRMVRGFGQKGAWIVLAFALSVWGMGTEACAQFRSTEGSPRPDTVQSFAPPPPAAGRSLETGHAGGRSPPNIQYEPVMNRRQKLLWGTIGMTVHAICDSEGTGWAFPKPDPLLRTRERICVECNRVGDRAFDAVVDGIFAPDS